MTAADAKIARICTESRTASNGTSAGVPDPKNQKTKPKKVQKHNSIVFSCLSNPGLSGSFMRKIYIKNRYLSSQEAVGKHFGGCF